MRLPLFALLPGALTVYLGYSAGGYFPPAIGLCCTVLAIALVLRLTLAEEPLAGLGLAAVAGAGALGLLAVWTLASTSWSDSPARAVYEFDRTLLYLLAFLLIASLPRTPLTARLLFGGLGAGAAIVCVGGVLTRLLPDTFAVDLPVLPQRLSYPITYWNGLGLLAVLGIVAAVHFACSEKEHPAARAAGAALLPVLATTLYFTFSRASIVVGIAAIVAYLVIARPRGLVAGVLAALPASLVAVKVAYEADLLASRDPTTSAAASQGDDVALVLALCMIVAAGLRLLLWKLGLDSRLERVQIARRTRRLAAAGAAGLLLVVAIGSWVAFDLGDRIDRQYERFKEGDTLEQSSDARDRLSDVSNNGRLDHWEQAIDSWQRDPLTGAGAGTYQLTWARYRSTEFTVRDGHSLYLETLSELGLVGALLLLAALALILVGLGLRARKPERALWAGMLVAAGAWAVHAGQDWMWELPVVTLWPVTLGAAALAQPQGSWRLPRIGRVIAALFVLGLAVTPVLAAVSHSRLNDSVAAFKQGDCATAVDDALGSTSALSSRPEPYAILAFCDVRSGELALAQRMMRNAVDRDPDNWEYHYGMALVLGADGKDPRPEIEEARRLNPLDGMLIRTQRALDTDDPQKWEEVARTSKLLVE